MPGIKRSLLFFLVVVLVLLLGTGALLWRVQNSPTSFMMVRPLIEAQLAKALPQADIAFENLVAHWNRGGQRVDLEFETLQFHAEGQGILAERVMVSVDAPALLKGKLRPIAVDINDVRIHLEPGEGDGALDYSAIRNEFKAALNTVFQYPQLEAFSQISLSNIMLSQTQAPAILTIHDGIFNFKENEVGGQLDGAFRMDVSEIAFVATLKGGYEKAARLSIDVQSDSLRTLLALFEDEQLANAYNGDLSAKINLEIAELEENDRVHLDLSIGEGQIYYPGIYDEPTDFQGLNAALVYQPKKAIARIEDFKLRFSDVEFALTGEVAAVGPKPDVSVKGQMTGLTVDSLKSYWPRSLGTGAYVWVRDNIDRGLLPNAELSFVATPEMWTEGLPAEALQFKFGIADLTAHYNRPMPPLVDAQGYGILSLDDLVLQIEEAKLAGLDVAASSVTIGPFSSRPQVADVALNFSGDVQKILLVLDSEPLGYISEFGLDPLLASGFTQAELTLSIPLLKDLKIEEVEFEGRVTGRDLVLADLINGQSLENGVADFFVDGDGLKTVGTIDYQGITAAVDWFEDFRDETTHPTNATITVDLTHEQLELLGFDPDNRFMGQISTTLEIVGKGVEIAKGTVRSDLSQAYLKDPVLGWEKPIGVSAQFTSELRAMNGKFSLIDAVLEGADLKAEFDFSADENGIVLSAQSIKHGASDFSVVAQQEETVWNLFIEGRSLDVGAVLQSIYEPVTPGEEVQQATPWPDLYGVVQLDKLVMANDVFLQNTKGTIRVVEDHFTNLELDGLLNNEAAFHLSLKEEKPEVRYLKLTSGNAGLAAKGLDLFTQGSGGDLRVEAEIRGRQSNMEIDGLGEMKAFRLNEAPVLARILSTASLTGIADLARDGRINFKDVRVPFTLRNGVFDIDEAAANGPAIGLTMNGQFVQSLAEANLNGVVVPAYGFNSIINKVPLVGGIITGGKNEGIFAINYSIKGPLTDPEIAVNPASMLAPGILRRIFRGGKPTVSIPDIDAEVEVPTPPQ